MMILPPPEDSPAPAAPAQLFTAAVPLSLEYERLIDGHEAARRRLNWALPLFVFALVGIVALPYLFWLASRSGLVFTFHVFRGYQIAWLLTDFTFVLAGWAIFGIDRRGRILATGASLGGRLMLVVILVLTMLPIFRPFPAFIYPVQSSIWLATTLWLYSHLFCILRTLEDNRGRRLILASILFIGVCRSAGIALQLVWVSRSAMPLAPPTSQVIRLMYIADFAATAGFACLGAAVFHAWWSICRRTSPPR